MEPSRVAKYRGNWPLTAGDLRRIVNRLDELGYPDQAVVGIEIGSTPYPEIVDIKVRDYDTTEGTHSDERDG